MRVLTTTSLLSVLWVLLLLVGTFPTTAAAIKIKLPSWGKGGTASAEPIPEPAPLSNNMDLTPQDWAQEILAVSKSWWIQLVHYTPDWIKHLVGQGKAVVLYKPPVGIVALWTVSRLVWSGRLWKKPKQTQASAAAIQRKDVKRHKGIAYELEGADVQYQTFGGVERVRRRLVWSALHGILKQERQQQQQYDIVGAGAEADADIPPLLPRLSSPDEQEMATLAARVLSHTYSAGSSQTVFADALLQDYALLQEQLQATTAAASRKTKTTTRSDDEEDIDWLIQMAARTGHVRLMDSLLRIARDRLLKTIYRVSATQQYWKRRVDQYGNTALFGFFLRFKLFRKRLEGDRIRLVFAEAAVQRELDRLGRLMQILAQRPQRDDASLDQSQLAHAVASTARLEQQTMPRKKLSAKALLKFPQKIIPKPSKWSFRLNPGGPNTKVGLYSYEESLVVGGRGALDALHMESADQSSTWMKNVDQWTASAKETLCEILLECHDESVQTHSDEVEQLRGLKSTWCVGSTSPNQDAAADWQLILDHVSSLSDLRRLGEAKRVKLKDTDLYNYLTQWDLLGLPSAALHIWLAFQVHKRLHAFGLEEIQEYLLESFRLVVGVVENRLWGPVRDFIHELFSREKNTLMQGLNLHDEEQSLDFMLRDLGFGDGTPEDRHQAMLQASRQYESDMKNGLIRHAMGGRLVRLILIQVQQLKVGMLSAVGTIDVLLQANQMNVRLITLIPVVVLVSFGTKLFVRTLFNLRAKDFRPIRSVLSQMVDYIDEMSEILLGTQAQPGQAAAECLSADQLGKFTFVMHEYLVLLDYASTALPKWQVDSMHRSLLSFLGSEGSMLKLDVNQQLNMMSHIKEKHQKLRKSI